MPLYIVLGQQRACMPVYIGKSGHLVRWHRCLTDRQTTEYSATQLLYSIQFKLSHAIPSLTEGFHEGKIGCMTCSADVFISSQMFSWPLDLGRGCIIWGWVTWREVARLEERLGDLKTQVCGHLFVLHELLMSAMMWKLKVILITPPSSSFLACDLQNRSQCNLPSFFNECFTPAKRSPQASRWGVELGRRRRKRRSWWRRWSGRTSRDYFLWLFHYRYIINRWFIQPAHWER